MMENISLDHSKKLCGCCVKEVGKDHIKKIIDKSSILFCSEECLDYYVKGDHKVKLTVVGKVINVYTRKAL